MSSNLQLGSISNDDRRRRSAALQSRPLASASPAPVRSAPVLRAVDSTELLGRDGIVVIEHAGERYTLRRTRHGRLILTK